MERGAPAELVEALSQAVGMPVVTCVSGWRSDVAVDFDEVAARHLIDRFEGYRKQRSVALFLMGRGASVGFADLVRRASRHIELHVLVPYLVTGRVGLAALSGHALRLGRYGAIGSVDAPCAHSTNPADVAASRGMARRILKTEDVSRLTHALLGAGQGLSPDELAKLGLPASDLDADADSATWALFEAYEQALGLREGPARRYEESDVGDEVEWEFAVGLPGGFIETSDDSLVYLLDTGRPDPDTGQLAGRWTSDANEEVLELDFDNARPAP